MLFAWLVKQASADFTHRHILSIADLEWANLFWDLPVQQLLNL